MAAAEALLAVATWWLYIGLVVAVLFLAFGLDRVDESARGAYVFRVMLIPGLILIWPIALYRWAILARGRDDWRFRHRPPLAAHGKVWILLGVFIPLIFLLAMFAREPNPNGLSPDLAPKRIGEIDR